MSLIHLQREVERHAFDLIIHVGDIGYDLHTDNGTVGDIFMRSMEAYGQHDSLTWLLPEIMKKTARTLGKLNAV